jgi:hypothetical protein
MNKVDKLVGVVFFGLIFIGIPCLAWWDFHHPENWEREPVNNPRVYLPVMAFLWCMSRYIVTQIAAGEREARRRARRATLLIRAETLIRQRRRDETEAVLKACKELLPKEQSK